MEQPPPQAEPPPAAAAQAPSQPAEPQGELFPYRPKPQYEAPPDLIVPRVLAEAFGGVLGGVGMGIVGLLAGASALENTDCSGGDGCAVLLILITVPAAFVGIPLGVQTAGQSLGGQGDFIPALGGTVLGTGAGLIFGLRSEGTGGMVAGLIVGPILGSIVGYELSHAIKQRRGYALSSQSGPRLLPMVGATPRGGLLGGLAGSF